METIKLNLASPAFKANPYPHYARLRETNPVVRVPFMGRRPGWLVTRYDDVLMLLRSSQFAKDPLRARDAKEHAKDQWVPAMLKPLTRNMLDLDAPDHTRLRALVQTAFTPRMIERLRPRIETLTDELLSRAQRSGRIELLSQYALPVPLTIIAELLGVPLADQKLFHHWSSKVASVHSPSSMFLALPALRSFIRYVQKMIAQRRADPRDDLISALVQAEAEGDKLSEDEVQGMIVLLLIAGHETTVNLIASGTLALLQHPEQCERLRRDPALITSAVEELVRYVSPVEVSTERYALVDTSIAGVTIRRGELVLAGIGSANHDPQQFRAPDTLDLSREPNRHLAFGLGAHFCLGAPLARMEAQIAITNLLARWPDLRLTVQPSQLRWRRSILMRGLQALPLAFS